MRGLLNSAVEFIPIALIKTDPLNPRCHSRQQKRAMARAIKRWGVVQPVIITDDTRMVCGHARLAACQLLNWEKIPALRISGLSDTELRLFALADNKLAENATWDQQLLSKIFADLADIELDVSLEITGFSTAEIDLCLEGQLEVETVNDDTVPSEVEARCKPGDLWRIGKHLLLCADARDPTAYRRLLGDAKAAAIFADPPYNVAIDGHATGKGRIRHREFKMAAGEMSTDQFVEFLTPVFGLLRTYSKDGSIHFQCMDWRHQEEILRAGHEAEYELKNMCVWVKSNPGMGSFYRSQHELIFVFKSGKGAHRNNIELGRHGRSRSNVWHYDGATGFGPTDEDRALLRQHPTVKPTAMIADAIRDCTGIGDLILDPFAGIASTLVAAERCRRVCRAIEIDPAYVDIALRRLELVSGQSAERIDEVKHDGE